MSISNPLFITFIFSLLAPKSSTISLKEFFEGVIILLIFSLSAPYILPILAAIIGPAAYLSPLILVNIYSCAIGNKIAWEHNNCSSEEDFFESQKKWKTAALVLTVIVLLGFIFLTL